MKKILYNVVTMALIISVVSVGVTGTLIQRAVVAAHATQYSEDPGTSENIKRAKEYGNPDRKGCILWLQYCKNDPAAKRWGVVTASRYLTEQYDDDIERMIDDLAKDPDTAATVEYVKAVQSKDWKTR